MWKVSTLSGKFQKSLESFRKVWKVSGQSRKFSDSLESFHTVWKVSRQAGKFPVRTVWKVSGQFGMFLTVWKGSRRSGNFPEGLESYGRFGIFPDSVEYFQTVCKVVCRKSDLHTFGAYMSRKRFTHSVRKVFAREILPTGKF